VPAERDELVHGVGIPPAAGNGEPVSERVDDLQGWCGGRALPAAPDPRWVDRLRGDVRGLECCRAGSPAGRSRRARSRCAGPASEARSALARLRAATVQSWLLRATVARRTDPMLPRRPGGRRVGAGRTVTPCAMRHPPDSMHSNRSSNGFVRCRRSSRRSGGSSLERPRPSGSHADVRLGSELERFRVQTAQEQDALVTRVVNG
jgi:hypothetical protein